MKNTLTPAISKDENDALVYDWAQIDWAAGNHAIVSTVLRDFAFDNVTEEMTAQELVDAYFAWLDAEKEAVEEAIYPLQCEWCQAQADFDEPTTDRTDEIIARHIAGIQHPGDSLRNAVFAAMEEWKAEVESSSDEVREFVASYEDDDEIPEEDLERIFALAYGRVADDSDRETGLWSLIVASVTEDK